MTITETTTPAPTIDFGPLLDLRARYTARAADLSAGIAERDADRITEARAFLAEQDQIESEMTATVRAAFDPSHPTIANDGSMAIGDLVDAVRATGDLSIELEEFDSAHEFEVACGIVDRVLEFLGDEMRAHEVALTPPGKGWIETAAQEFAKNVRSGWDRTAT